MKMRSLGLMLLRVVIGIIMIAHGYPKLFGGQGKAESLPDEAKDVLGEGFVDSVDQGGIAATTGAMESLGVPQPELNAWSIGLVEFVGGLAMVLGWKTRPAAVAITFSQLVAINKAHAEQGLVGGYEFNASLIAGAGCIALAGPGKLSVDG
ncbi:MAG: DoxX family protein [Chloroflexia bacterium]|jgi:putative oxidoreductase|nr:DoxX family protein [Chloroflexia bacterium]